MTKAEKRDKYLRDTYGISTEIYAAMLAHQGGVCAICLKPPKPGRRLHVDHDHKTMAVRGALCHWCNRKILGRRREDPDIHQRAAAYLRSGINWQTCIPFKKLLKGIKAQSSKASKAKARATTLRLRRQLPRVNDAARQQRNPKNQAPLDHADRMASKLDSGI